MNKTATATAINTQKDKRKQQLIDATIQCISEYGLSSTTISRVTRAAGLSTGIANFYFSGKEQLLLETLQFLSNEYDQVVELAYEFGDSPREVLVDVIRAHFDPQVFDPDKIAVWYAFTSESRAREEYLSICEEKDAAFLESMLGAVTRLCEQSGRTDLNSLAIARGLEGLIDGFWQQALFKPDAVDVDEAIALCEDYLSAFFPRTDTCATTDSPSNQFNQNPSEAISRENIHDVPTSDLLAPWTYYNEELFQLEQDILFRKQWLLAGHLSDIPLPRDYLTFDAAGQRALILRDHNNQIHAYHNVCRHRGAKLVDKERGQCAHALTCPFHGWTYDLEGALVSVPAVHTFDNLVLEDNGLVTLDLEIWMGFIFIRFAGDGPSMAESMKPVEHLVKPYLLDQVQPLAGTSYRQVRPYNWKVIHDIDNEGYHVPVGHPSLQQLYGKSYIDEVVDGVPVSSARLNEKPGKLWSVRNYQNLLPRFDHLGDDNQRLWLYIGVFPSMVIGLYPESVEFYMSIPRSIDSSWYIGASYALSDDRRETRAVRYLSKRINNITEKEDEDYVRWLQEGMNSIAFPEPKLSSIEQGVRHFHKRIQAEIPVANLAQPPAANTVRRVNERMTG